MLQSGQILHDRYQLQQKLGQNAGRQTWLAEDQQQSPPEPVVLKLLSFGGDIQWEDLKLFERESQVLQQLQHPRIPRYRDYFPMEDRTLWFTLVQDYIPGESLKDLLVLGRHFDEAQIRKIAEEVLLILMHLHRLSPPILHRDIKPSNLIWGQDDHLYLVDFGAVQDRMGSEGATFTVVGTYGYAPVEQFGGRTVPASDLYALGATLIHLLTGISPADLPQRNLQIQFSDRVSITPHLVRWLQKLTEPALEKRFPTAESALEALVTEQLQALVEAEPEAFPMNNSGEGKLFDRTFPVPKEIRGWNWGAFLLAPYWSLTNRVWIGLLCWLTGGTWLAVRILAFTNPLYLKLFLAANVLVEVGLMALLGWKGNEWAWKSSQWRSIQHFKKHQRTWAIAGLLIGIPFFWFSLWQKYWLIFFILR